MVDAYPFQGNCVMLVPGTFTKVQLEKRFTTRISNVDQVSIWS